MSNMLYACSIMYRMRLPMVVVYNKADIQDYSTIETWLRDYEVSLSFSEIKNRHSKTLSVMFIVIVICYH